MVSLIEGSPVERKENGHVTEVVTLMEGERSCYRGPFQRWSCIMEGE